MAVALTLDIYTLKVDGIICMNISKLPILIFVLLQGL